MGRGVVPMDDRQRTDRHPFGHHRHDGGLHLCRARANLTHPMGRRIHLARQHYRASRTREAGHESWRAA